MAEKGCLHGVLGFGIIAGLAWLLSPDVSDEDIATASACQDRAVALDLGVVVDPKTGYYFYSENKIKELEYYRFMYNCLPDSYPTKLDIKRSLIDLEEELGIDN